MILVLGTNHELRKIHNFDAKRSKINTLKVQVGVRIEGRVAFSKALASLSNLEIC